MRARIAWAVWLIVSLNLADAQESVYVKTTVERAPSKPIEMPSSFKPVEPTPAPKVWKSPHDMGRVRIGYGPGGSIGEHRKLYNDYQNTRTEVAIAGGCYSACTLVLAHVDADLICVAEGGFLAFHSAQTTVDEATAQKHPLATRLMYLSYPTKIREWIDRQGGVDRLPGPGQGYWVMYNHELWAMGYAKCK